MAIVSFKDKRLEAIFSRRATGKGFPTNLLSAVERKLQLLDAVATLDELNVPRNNRLEALKGDLSGLWSIRVNDQFRVVFRWTEMGPAEVRFVDYH